MNLIHRVGSIKPLNEDTFLMTIESAEIAAAGLRAVCERKMRWPRCLPGAAFQPLPGPPGSGHIRYRCQIEAGTGIVPYA